MLSAPSVSRLDPARRASRRAFGGRAAIRLLSWLILAALEGPSLPAAAFQRGDVDASGGLSITDPVRLLGYLFLGDPAGLECASAADVDDDSKLTLSDAVYALNSLFQGGPAPGTPFPLCGPDPTPDNLDCMSYAPCAQACDSRIEAIQKESSIVGSCSAVVRFRYVTRQILGWQMFCGKYHHADEALARMQAQADTGYGTSARMLNDPEPEDLYVFYVPPGDFGGAGVVSARTGATVFGGSIIWDGAGDITYPKQWRSIEGLGQDCAAFQGDVSASSHDLTRDGAAVDPADIGDLVGRLRTTALLEGLARSGYIFEAVVLVYPRSVGVFNPETAEWIVILNAGWLE